MGDKVTEQIDIMLRATMNSKPAMVVEGETTKDIPAGEVKRSTKARSRVTPKQVEQVIEGKALGIPERSIAEQVGTSGATVNRISHRPEVRERINQLATELIEEGHQAVKANILSTITTSNEAGVQQGDKDTTAYRLGLRKLSLQASNKLLDITGLTQQHPSTVVQTLINVAGDAVISDPVKAILQQHALTIHKENDQ